MNTQAETVFKKLGDGDLRRGRNRVGEKLPISGKQLRCWNYPKERGGTGGLIPTARISELLDAFPDELSPNDLFPSA